MCVKRYAGWKARRTSSISLRLLRHGVEETLVGCRVQYVALGHVAVRLLDAQLNLDREDLRLGQYVAQLLARLLVEQPRALVEWLRLRLVVDIALGVNLDLWREQSNRVIQCTLAEGKERQKVSSIRK